MRLWTTLAVALAMGGAWAQSPQDLLNAVRRGDVDRASQLVAARVDTEARGPRFMTPLLIAIANRDGEMLELLVEAGARLDARDEIGSGPIHIAARSTRVPRAQLNALVRQRIAEADEPLEPEAALEEVVEEIAEAARLATEVALRAGADPNAADLRGETPMHLAARFGQVEMVRLLLERSARKDVRDRQGRTALHAAVVGGRLEIVEALIEAGYRLSIRDAEANTPLDLAQNRRREDLIAVLRAAAMPVIRD